VDKLSAIRSFNAVARLGSFSKAANQLNLTQATVSKKVAALEELLECQLLVRNSRKLTLTENGSRYYAQAAELLSDLDTLEDQLRDDKNRPKGSIKLTAPIPFASRILIPALARFFSEYPEISVELDLSDNQQDLVAERFDIAIRASDKFDDSTLIAQNLFENNLWLVASPDYLSRTGTPKTPKDLEQHSFIYYSLFKPYRRLRLRKGKRFYEVSVGGNLASNSGDTILAAVLNGIGIGELPLWMIDSHLATGDLVRVLPSYVASSAPFKIVYPRRDLMPVRVKVLIDFLRTNLKPTQTKTGSKV
jgi:DNA-binding transcriptional LysR family regulator